MTASPIPLLRLNESATTAVSKKALLQLWLRTLKFDKFTSITVLNIEI